MIFVNENISKHSMSPNVSVFATSLNRTRSTLPLAELRSRWRYVVRWPFSLYVLPAPLCEHIVIRCANPLFYC